MHIDRLGDLSTALGECPVWHDDRLWLLDCRAGLLLALDGDSGAVLARHQAPAPLGCFAFNGEASAQVVLALKEELVLQDLASGTRRTLARIEDSHPHLRLNDGTALADGSFLVGTMHTFREPGEPALGGLYRLGTDLTWRKLEAGNGLVNGPCVNPLNGRLHVADSTARQVYSYALTDDGRLADKQLFLDTDAHGSGPDGCAFDTEGGLWMALVRVGALARFDMQGRLTHRIELPLAYPSALCFGGPGLRELYVTSIRDSGRLRADGALDGAVLKIGGLGFAGLDRPRCRLPC